MTKHTNDLFEELAKETNSSAIDDFYLQTHLMKLQRNQMYKVI